MNSNDHFFFLLWDLEALEEQCSYKGTQLRRDKQNYLNSDACLPYIGLCSIRHCKS